MAVAGLTSVTFRELSAAEVLCLAKEAGLAGLEWGGDIHLPPECPELAEELARRTAQAGLRSLSYGRRTSAFGQGIAVLPRRTPPTGRRRPGSWRRSAARPPGKGSGSAWSITGRP